MRCKCPPSLVAMLFSHTLSANDCITTAHGTTGTHYEPVTEQRKILVRESSYPGRD